MVEARINFQKKSCVNHVLDTFRLLHKVPYHAESLLVCWLWVNLYAVECKTKLKAQEYLMYISVYTVNRCKSFNSCFPFNVTLFQTIQQFPQSHRLPATRPPL